MPARTAYAGTALDGDVYLAANHARMPGGWIGYASIVADFVIPGADTPITGLSIAVTVGASRRIRVTGGASVLQNVGILTRIYGSIQQDGAAVGCFGEHTFDAGDFEERIEASAILTPSAGAHTYRLTMLAADSGGTPTGVTVKASAARPAFILVEDLGPAA